MADDLFSCSQASSATTSKPAARKKWDEVVDQELGDEKQEVSRTSLRRLLLVADHIARSDARLRTTS